MTKPQVRTRTRVQPATPANLDPDFSCNQLHDELRLVVRYERADKLKALKRILRKHSDRQLQMIGASIREHAFNNPILVDVGICIVSGYGRWMAAIALGMVEVPVIVLEHLSPEQLRLYAIADNRIAEQSEFDLGELKLELAELDRLDLNLDLTGFNTSEIDDMLVDPNDDPPVVGGRVEAVAITRPGDLWQLGDHRLICGNSLEVATFEALMGGEKAAMVFADAPYNLPSSAISGMGQHQHANFAMAAGEMSRPEFTTFLARPGPASHPQPVQAGHLRQSQGAPAKKSATSRSWSRRSLLAGFRADTVAISRMIGSSKKGNHKSHGANSTWVLRLQHRRQKLPSISLHRSTSCAALGSALAFLDPNCPSVLKSFRPTDQCHNRSVSTPPTGNALRQVAERHNPVSTCARL